MLGFVAIKGNFLFHVEPAFFESCVTLCLFCHFLRSLQGTLTGIQSKKTSWKCPSTLVSFVFIQKRSMDISPWDLNYLAVKQVSSKLCYLNWKFTQSYHWPHESTAKEMHGWRIALCSAFDSPYWPGVVSKLLFSLLWGIFWRFSVFPSPQKATPQI